MQRKPVNLRLAQPICDLGDRAIMAAMAGPQKKPRRAHRLQPQPHRLAQPKRTRPPATALAAGQGRNTADSHHGPNKRNWKTLMPRAVEWLRESETRPRRRIPRRP